MDAIFKLGVAGMPIHALLARERGVEGAVFSPEDLIAITTAFEAALVRLKVVDRKEPMAVLVAKATIQIAKEGERNPHRKRRSARTLPHAS
jgi:hypothetical protein